MPCLEKVDLQKMIVEIETEIYLCDDLDNVTLDEEANIIIYPGSPLPIRSSKRIRTY